MTKRKTTGGRPKTQVPVPEGMHKTSINIRKDTLFRAKSYMLLHADGPQDMGGLVEMALLNLMEPDRKRIDQMMIIRGSGG